MTNLRDCYLFSAIFINYSEGLKGCLLIESENGVIPIELKEEDLNFLTFYPNIMEKLINGRLLYLKGFNVYLGKKETFGPYCEHEIFISEYDSENINFYELIANLESKIEKRESNVRKLSKLGIYYN